MASLAMGKGIRGREEPAGWLFTTPMIVLLGAFLFIPVSMALYVSMTRWNGNDTPFGGPNAPFVGVENYTKLFTQEGLARSTFMQSLGNTFYYVLLVVPLQTVASLLLALIVNNKLLKGKSFFRTAFYFPSVTSSIAISVVFLFLFQNSGAVNGFLRVFGIDGPAWFSDARGLFHIVLGWLGQDNPGWAQGDILGRSLWEWLSGPSVAMTVIIGLAVWTTTGTFMLMFLAALQDLPVEVDEAAELDGVNAWQRFRFVTVPQLKPAIFLVTTLGLIGTWQVFDQIYVMGKGAPAGTTLTPAYLSYSTSFNETKYGEGAAMAFVIFLIIIAITFFQRRLMADDRKPLLRGRLRRGTSTGVASS